MILGKRQTLKLARIKDFGGYLTDLEEEVPGEAVLLPKKELPPQAVPGDTLEVFLYRDSKDRLIATTRTPLAQVGDVQRLRVSSVTKIGSFLDIGLERDVLLPFRESIGTLQSGDHVLVKLYEDKTHRLAATMKIYPYLSSQSPYKKDDQVRGSIYSRSKAGFMVAVDNAYYGLIPENEAYGALAVGEEISARVVRVREDGKLDLSPRKKAYLQLEEDAGMIWQVLQNKGGSLGFDDKADKERIKKELGISKNAFKRAVGHLLKEGKIEIKEGNIFGK